MNKKKLLFVHHASTWGGAPKSMIDTINLLDRDDYDPYVLLLKDSQIKEKLIENNIPFKIAESFFYRKYYQFFSHSEAGYLKWYRIDKAITLISSWLLSRYFFAKRELDLLDFDLAHLNSSVLTDWLAPCHEDAKTIIHIREPFRKGNFDILNYFFRRQMKLSADSIIAISKDIASRVNLPDKTNIIYNYGKIPKEKPNQNSYSSKLILYIGGSARIKGFYTLVKALPFLDKNIKIYFGGNYGQFNNASKLKAMLRGFIPQVRQRHIAMKKINDCPQCEMIGLVYNVEEYLDKVCCAISPFSKPHFSRPVIEAFLHSKPAIASDVSGMSEVLKHKENGLLFKKNDFKALAHCINYIANHPEKGIEMGDNAYDFAISRFTENNVDSIIQIYDDLLTPAFRKNS